MRRRSFSRSIVGVLPFPYGGAQGSYVLLIAVSAGLMLFSALKPQAFDGMRAGVADVFAPVLGVVSQPLQRAGLFVRDVTGLAALQADNARLSQENETLREWYQTAMLLEAENKSLRNLLNVRIEPQNTYVSARVIADSGNAYVRSLLVSAGLRDGVGKGQAVLSGDGLVGRIVEAGQTASRILLVTDMNSRVPVIVEDTLQHAIMAGTNTEMPELIHMPKDSEVADGARIMTSGHGGVFPPGLPVGRVSVDETGKRSVTLFSDVERMLYVRVVKKPDDPNLRPGALLPPANP